jgi:transcriptional regulator with XRE-family HTH domain
MQETVIPRKRGQKIAAGEIDRLIGMRIRIARNMFHKRQEDLANFLGLTLQQTQKYENGKNKMSVNLLTQVADFFNIPIAYFIPTTVGSAKDNAMEMLTMAQPIQNVAEDWRPIGEKEPSKVTSAKKVSEDILPIEIKQNFILELIDILTKIDPEKQQEFLQLIKNYQKMK